MSRQPWRLWPRPSFAPTCRPGIPGQMSSGLWSRGGHRSGATLVELVVALPVLAVGVGVAAAFMISSSAHLGVGETRLQAAIQSIAVMDSLRLGTDATGQHGPSPGGGSEGDGAGSQEGATEGNRPVADAEMTWRWDGCCRLEIQMEGGRAVGGLPPQGPGWVLVPAGEPVDRTPIEEGTP